MRCIRTRYVMLHCDGTLHNSPSSKDNQYCGACDRNGAGGDTIYLMEKALIMVIYSYIMFQYKYCFYPMFIEICEDCEVTVLLTTSAAKLEAYFRMLLCLLQAVCVTNMVVKQHFMISVQEQKEMRNRIINWSRSLAIRLKWSGRVAQKPGQASLIDCITKDTE